MNSANTTKTPLVQRRYSPRPWAALFTLFLVAGWGACTPKNQIDTALKRVGGIDRNGNLVLVDQLPAKRAVVNFFALNCPPCFHELPSLRAVHKKIRKKYKNKTAFYLIAYTQTGEQAKARPIADIPPTGNTLKPLQKELLKRLDDLWGEPAPVLFADGIFPFPNPLVVATPETVVLERRRGKLHIAYHLVGSIDSFALQFQKKKDGYTLEGSEVMARFKKDNPDIDGNLSDPKTIKKFEIYRDGLLLDQCKIELEKAGYQYIKDQRVAYLLNKLDHSQGSQSSEY